MRSMCSECVGEQCGYAVSTWTTCYPHIALQVKKEWKPLLKEKEYASTISNQLSLMHLSRTRRQFDQLALVVKGTWTRLCEVALVHAVVPEYFESPYNW